MLEKSEDLKFTNHRVKIKIEGYNIERLISKAMTVNIQFKNFRHIDETELMVTVSNKDYTRLKRMAGSTYKITKINEKGIRPTGRKMKNNPLFPVGFVLFIVYFLVQSMFIKEVSIEGNITIPEESIREVVEAQGLYEGGLKNFDCKKIEENLFKDFSSIVWADVDYEGKYAKVRVAENNQYPKKPVDDKTPCDIIATESGYIDDIRTYKGKAKVAKNDYFRKGEILIAGTIPIEYSSYQPTEEDPENFYVHATGIIKARIPYYYSFTMTKKATKDMAKRRIRQWIKENVPEKAQIVNKSLNFIKKENIIRVCGIIDTRQEIGIEKEILIDQRNGKNKKDSDRR